ncbi:MAG TPA: penicillin-binding protein 2 [Jiangellaceae bacterium]|nr:penicillin-binding protein 2 [Jiangellaceae bacterium]
MNGPIRKVAAGCMLLVFLLLANITYVQAIRADELNSRSDNRRVLLDEYAKERGPILVGDEPVALSVETDDEFAYLRQYPVPLVYAPATGYYSSVFGRSAVERSENDILSGNDDRLFARRLVDLVTNREQRGGTVKLTLNPAAQQAAYDALGDNKGAVVALDPRTGAILAMVSKPSYDPNPLASHSVAEQQAAWQVLQEDPEKPTLNRAIAQTLPPGSVFKIVTAAAALESGRYEPDSLIPGPAEYDLPQSTVDLPNQSGEPCGSGPDELTTLTNALRVSCNTAFAYLGNDLGDDALREQAERFGYNSEPLTDEDLNAATSIFPAELDAPQTALAAIGQFDVRATPLQIAMVSAGIANDGTVMNPYLIEELRDPDRVKVLERTEPEELSRAVSTETAQELTAMMVEVVENGTGQNGQLDGVQVAGKTGTAQTTAERPPYAWFTSFAPADDAQIAVAVVIEEAPDTARDDIAGGRLAAPVAKAVMEAVLG